MLMLYVCVLQNWACLVCVLQNPAISRRQIGLVLSNNQPSVWTSPLGKAVPQHIADDQKRLTAGTDNKSAPVAVIKAQLQKLCAANVCKAHQCLACSTIVVLCCLWAHLVSSLLLLLSHCSLLCSPLSCDHPAFAPIHFCTKLHSTEAFSRHSIYCVSVSVPHGQPKISE